MLNRLPRVALTLADDELCNGESVNIQLSTVTIPYRGIEFNVDAINSYPEITGYTDRTGFDRLGYYNRSTYQQWRHSQNGHLYCFSGDT